jgi:hypothetical protein
VKKLAWILGAIGLLGSLGYLFSYIIRWQWNRALFSGLAAVALLVVLGTAAVLRKIGQLEDRIEGDAGAGAGAIDEATLADLRATRPQRDHFAWLRDRAQHTNVFITVLLGGGVVVSGVAWVIGKLAEGTATPAAEHRLAQRLGPLRFPDAGLQPATDAQADEATVLLRQPTARGRR